MTSDGLRNDLIGYGGLQIIGFSQAGNIMPMAGETFWAIDFDGRELAKEVLVGRENSQF